MLVKNLIKDLGDGLVLRRSSQADIERIAAFNIRIHSNGTDLDNRCLDAWTRDLMSGDHPTFGVGDFTVVEDTLRGEIVSCLNLISQTWTYDGIPFGVGRPELVGTLPDYRRRGLVRLQFEEIHRWSLERGELAQAITGIPNYYRQFGYEMAINLGGGRSGSSNDVPALKKDETEPYLIRTAEISDIPFLIEVMAFGNQRYPVACLWTPELLAYELNGKLEFDVNRLTIYIITDTAGEPVGFFTHPVNLWDFRLAATSYELKPGVSWLEVTPCVARCLWEKGQVIAQRDGVTCLGFSLGLGEAHPAYQVFSHRQPGYRQPYAWYMRVPDLPVFLNRVSKALERRLKKSPCCGYSGDLVISFYRSGLKITIEKGLIKEVLPLGATELKDPGAAFPNLTFLQLVFGYRSLDEIKYAYADCFADNDRAAPLLNALFPRSPSDIWPVS